MDLSLSAVHAAATFHVQTLRFLLLPGHWINSNRPEKYPW